METHFRLTAYSHTVSSTFEHSRQLGTYSKISMTIVKVLRLSIIVISHGMLSSCSRPRIRVEQNWSLNCHINLVFVIDPGFGIRW